MKTLRFILIFILLFFSYEYISTTYFNHQKHIVTYTTKDQKYELKGFMIPGSNATIDNSVFIDLYDKKTGEKIQKSFYTQYGESTLTIEQPNDNDIIINENKVSLKKIQKNDFTKEEK